MSNKSFDNYLHLAQMNNVSDVEVAGRYAFQAEAERNILLDVANKLSLCGGDRLLEIGCGPGNLLIPLSYLVERSAGIDNASSLERLHKRTGGSCNIDLYPGNFLEMNLPSQRFNKILIYGVVQLLDSMDAVICFISRALSLLDKNGVLLLGDLSNQDKKKRWLNSKTGKDATADWMGQTAKNGPHPMSALEADRSLVALDDNFVMQAILYGRSMGFESYLLPQPSALPFGNSREDILYFSRM
jgi:cyclopropane fatty-acyl-phospholipid synthase-like methyltransferase